MRTLHRINGEYIPKCQCNVAAVDDAAIASAAIGAAGSIAGAAINGVSATNLNKKNRKWQEQQQQKQMEWNEKMWNQTNDWNLQMWEKTNEYNSPTAQIQRLKDAGLNPLYYGLDGSSANSFEASQPLGYQQAQLPNQVNPVGEALNSFAQLKGLENSTKLANAQIDKIREESSGLKLDNQFKEDTLAAREEGVKLANEATKKQLDEVDSRIKVNEQSIKESIARTENEVEKKGLIIAEKLLTQAKEKEILEMLPLNKMLVKAQTDAQKANAAASWANAAIQKGLLDGGYVEKTLDELSAKVRKENNLADDAQWKARQDEMKAAILSGNAFDLSDKDPVSRAIGQVANSFFSIISVASNAGFSGIKL